MNAITRRNSISSRLTLMVAGILTMATLVTGGMALFEQERQLNYALETKGTSLVQFMAQVTPLSILSLNFVEMNNNVKKVVLTDNEAIYAIILNEQGIPLVYFFEEIDPLVTNPIRQLVEAKKPLAASEALRQTGRILEVMAPIFSGEKRIGSAMLGLSFDQMRRALLSQLALIGIFLIVIIGFSIVLLRLALQQILRPVGALTTAATQISRGDLNVVLTGVNRTDELGILARTFESMAGQLRRLIVGLEQHVAELKRAGQALRESEERLRQIASSLREVIWLRDARTRQVLYVNPAFEELTGRTCESFYENQDIMIEAVHPDDKELVTAALDQRSESIPFNREHRIIRLDGSVRWVSARSFPVRNEAGDVYRWASTMEDITERKRAEEEIQKLNQELEQRVLDRTAQLETANKELEAFAYSVSHDLRAPLRHIDGFLELLQTRITATLDEQNQHYMDTISESAKRMGVLIDDLLSFSRMGRHDLARQAVELNSLVQEVIRDFEPETRGRTIRWRIADLPVVTGDRAMLRVVLVNLISNALKFTRSRLHADIEIGYEAGSATERVFFIRDNGVGFDMAYVDKLFGVFQRLHRADEFEGTGIGLANVRRIISRHGGRTWAQGEVNHGATFYFSLPRLTSEG